MDCSNCQKKLEDETNFCPRCGFKQHLILKCPICLENKKVSTLLCGHNVCIVCINTSYKNKQQCPMCRESIEKCPECYQYRVVKMPDGKKKCLDCKTKIINVKTIINSKKLICIECRSSRILFDPLTSRYNCSDCFGYFDSNTSHITPVPKTKICMVCLSNTIEFMDYPLVEDNFDRFVLKNRCKNCGLENVETKNISLEEYSKLVVKSKQEVNPDIIKICPNCDSNDIYTLETTVNSTFNCNNCSNNFLSPKIIKC